MNRWIAPIQCLASGRSFWTPYDAAKLEVPSWRWLHSLKTRWISSSAVRKQGGLGGHSPVPASMENVRYVIAVASGKGGVGKSTIAVNLSVALSRLNLKIGILDADIYGPSVPTLLNLPRKKPDWNLAGKMMIPPEQYNLKAMSIGLLLPEDNPDQPIVWRGPMAAKALEQMINQTEWGDLDILIVDMPPGTGDIQLSLAQRVPLSGAVIVSTPQEIALMDARKAVGMFQKVNVPILGLVENMNRYVCKKCRHEEYIFGSDEGIVKDAERLKLDLVGRVPLTVGIRAQSDLGVPITVADPGSPESREFDEIASRVFLNLGRFGDMGGPTLSVE